MLEKIPLDYISTIPKQKPTTVSVYRTDLPMATQKPKSVMIPPINTNIDISMLSKFDPRVHLPMIKDMKPLPTSFNWTEDKSKDITKVGNQRSCGCCWAFACSDAVSDVFVVSGKVKENPKCSVTFALSCYPNCKDFSNMNSCSQNQTSEFPYSFQCNGGAIAPLLLWISRNGIGTVECENFDWCEKNNGCTQGSIDTTSLNYLIPECGCSKSSSNNQLYYISTPISKGLVANTPTQKEIDEHVQIIKQWIYRYGTIVTGFFVYSNLMIGQFKHFEKNPDGIYLEDVDYHTHQLFENQTNEFKGGHAVCIVGWGVGKVANSLISDRKLRNPNSQMTEVPYWIARNSWTTEWGDNGLFRMAMYPFNKVAQFDKYVIINTPQGRGEAGGQVVFMPSTIKQQSQYKESYQYSSQENNMIGWASIIIVTTLLIILLIYFATRKPFSSR